MKTESAQTEYIMLFRGTRWDKDLSPEEIQQTMTEWMAWFNGMVEKGKIKGGHPLKNDGVVVTNKGVHTDGPFAESKEAVGGYCLLTVENLEEAIEIANLNPGVKHGMIIELRPVAAMCPVEQRLADMAATTSA